MRGLLLYILFSGVLLDCPSAQCWRRRPAARSAATPGAVGPAGLNATWIASTYAFGRPPFASSVATQYRRSKLTIFPWTRTRSGPKIRVS